jgi:DNA (cytosine-5)-methyltransferase 1
MWPTPNIAGGGNPASLLTQKGNHFVRRSGEKAHLSLDQAVMMWPTPSSNNGLAGGQGNRLKLYAMLGEEEGKQIGCQSINPYWVEWLMGYPLGWTDCEDSATPLSRKSRKR